MAADSARPPESTQWVGHIGTTTLSPGSRHLTAVITRAMDRSELGLEGRMRNPYVHFSTHFCEDITSTLHHVNSLLTLRNSMKCPTPKAQWMRGDCSLQQGICSSTSWLFCHHDRPPLCDPHHCLFYREATKKTIYSRIRRLLNIEPPATLAHKEQIYNSMGLELHHQTRALEGGGVRR